MAADRTTKDAGATAARRSDQSSIWPWVLAALIVAALVIGAVWLMGDADSESDVITNEADVPAVEPGLEGGTGVVPDEGEEQGDGGVLDDSDAGTLEDEDSGAGMGEEDEAGTG